ncbi:MAG: ArsR/SmtB family transcription factor [Planctomycetota bacterium]|jgi:DNA-binding transcriptional ArsR family regulator
MRDFMAVTRALADQNRVRVLIALQRGELCVCQIIALLELAPSTVSKHMALLHQAGLVNVRRDGRWRYYRLPGKSAPPATRSALKWIRDALAGNEVILRDARKLKSMGKTPPALTCASNRQRTGVGARGQ